MPGRENRSEHMLVVAADLFMQKGYNTTTIREIAHQAGCTEAAIYYHFKGGKRELLRRVIGLARVELQAPLRSVGEAASLADLIVRYGEAIRNIWRGRVHRTIRWMICELHNLSEEEKAYFYVALLGFHEDLTKAVQRFVPGFAEASEIAWLLLCTSFGYRQIFYDLEVEALMNIKVTGVFNLIANGITEP